MSGNGLNDDAHIRYVGFFQRPASADVKVSQGLGQISEKIAEGRGQISNIFVFRYLKVEE